MDSRRRLLLRDEAVVPLPGKALEVLLLLLEVPGQVRTREELLTQVWRGAEVADSSLTQSVLMLRRALGDSATSPTLIETVSRYGYRFTGQLEPSAVEPLVSTAVDALGARSIAVLPMWDLVADEPRHYLGIGLADALIARLLCLPEVQVRPSNLVQQFAQRMDPVQVGQMLGVRNVLAGTFRYLDGQMTVNAQLLDVRSGKVIWAERLGERLDDLFEIENRLAARLVQTLAPRLPPLATADFHGTRDIEAYRLFLKGSHAAKLLRKEAFMEACEALNEALRRDPGYARAWLGLALAYQNAAELWLPSESAMSEAKRCAQQALALEPGLAAAHCILAGVHWWFERDLPACNAALERALALDPGAAQSLRLAAGIRAQCGFHEEAALLLEQSAATEAHDLELHHIAATASYFARRFDASIASARRLQQSDPQSWLARLSIGRAREAQGQMAAAVDQYELALASAPQVAEVYGDLGRGLARCDRKEEARAVLAQLDASTMLVPAWVRAQILLGLDDRKACLQELERVVEERSWFASWFICAPMLDSLADCLEFQTLRQRAMSP